MFSFKVNFIEIECILLLYYYDEYFDVIIKDNVFFGYSFYCMKCDCVYKVCLYVCEMCKCM